MKIQGATIGGNSVEITSVDFGSGFAKVTTVDTHGTVVGGSSDNVVVKTGYSPYIGDDGYWYVYDNDSDTFVNTNVKASEEITDEKLTNLIGDYMSAHPFEEVDPTVPQHVKEISQSDIDSWDSKSTFSGNYNDLEEKPTIPTVPTSEIESNTRARHVHLNKNTLDNITDEKLAEWNSKSDFDGDYNSLTNKPTIPTVPTSEIAENTRARHTHSNKTILDSISGQKIAEWDSKSSFSGDYNDLVNKPTIPLVPSDEIAQNSSARHTHINKSVIDGISESKVAEWDAKFDGRDAYTKQEVDEKVDGIAYSKFPNLTIIGEPLINNGSISRFSATSYAMFPFVVDFKGFPFKISACFTTGTDVVNQGNIFDSDFGLAFAISNRHFVLAYSINGTVWDFAENGTFTVQPNTTYYVDIEWNGSVISLSYSVDGKNFATDITHAESQQPYPKQIYVGVGDINYNAPKVFGGTINLNLCELYISGKLVWQGMDDVGLATRLSVDLGNIDVAGIVKVKEIISEVGYAKPDDIPSAEISANTSARHTHSNKSVLDGITAEDVATWSSQGGFSGDYNDLRNKPEIPTVPTDEISANTSARHSHSNKTILDSISQTKVNSWDAKSNFSGSYNDLSDKPSIPTVPTEEISQNTFARHTHANKSVLDNITSSKVTEWNNKSTFSGSYNDLSNKPSLFSGSYNDLSNKPTIPSDTHINELIEAKISSIVNGNEVAY